MNQYLDKVYEWLPTEPTDPTILLNDTMLTQHLAGGAAVMGIGPDPLNAIMGLGNTLLNDPNSQLNPARDSTQGFFQIPLIMKGGTRTAVRDFIVSIVAQGYPLTVRQNCHVTQINFDTSGSTPIATGVNFLDGEYLYSASPFSGGTSTPGTATATKELIVAAGSFNTPQLLKLSGIGASEELNNFNISVISNLPGVGTNMQDRYEIPVNVKHGNDFQILKGCTFDGKAHDICLQKWQDNPNILAQRGPYATDDLAATMAVNSDFASTSHRSIHLRWSS